MTNPQLDPLAGALVKPLRIRFYIDGWHSYLLSKEMVGLHRSFLKVILAEFPQHAAKFDLKLSPEKQASLVVKLLMYVEDTIVAREEGALVANGVDVIPKSTVDSLRNSFSFGMPIFGSNDRFEPSGKTFVDAKSYGVVFCPIYDKRYLEDQISEYINSLSVDSNYYELVIDELRQARKQLQNGNFERTQRYYDALADEIGDVSQRGFLKVSQNARRKVLEEKGVDGDMIASLASDAYKDAADVFVLLTNDADHAPLAERLIEDGKKILVIGYASKPARALRRAVGDRNVLNLLTKEREFDFDPVWLHDEDAHASSVLEDVRMQWHWWKSQGMI